MIIMGNCNHDYHPGDHHQKDLGCHHHHNNCPYQDLEEWCEDIWNIVEGDHQRLSTAVNSFSLKDDQFLVKFVFQNKMIIIVEGDHQRLPTAINSFFNEDDQCSAKNGKHELY